MSDMEARLLRVEDAVISIKDSLQALVRLEAHHAETREGLARAFRECEKNEAEIKEAQKRIGEIEKILPGLVETRGWVVTALIGTIGLVGLGMWGLFINTRMDRIAHPMIQQEQHHDTSSQTH